MTERSNSETPVAALFAFRVPKFCHSNNKGNTLVAEYMLKFASIRAELNQWKH